jgi:hypothetical protein
MTDKVMVPCVSIILPYPTIPTNKLLFPTSGDACHRNMSPSPELQETRRSPTA